jgi:hypothetical protein
MGTAMKMLKFVVTLIGAAMLFTVFLIVLALATGELSVNLLFQTLRCPLCATQASVSTGSPDAPDVVGCRTLQNSMIIAKTGDLDRFYGMIDSGDCHMFYLDEPVWIGRQGSGDNICVVPKFSKPGWEPGACFFLHKSFLKID